MFSSGVYNKPKLDVLPETIFIRTFFFKNLTFPFSLLFHFLKHDQTDNKNKSFKLIENT